ncbi:hypothetical protein [Halorussus ruber]|uniref:hypothetical protein n=1 Tax=Halorussus ruber TaxID=1126238 RepID=UPI00143D8F93|nr:hypothetical protein [Halorussus ruber]
MVISSILSLFTFLIFLFSYVFIALTRQENTSTKSKTKLLKESGAGLRTLLSVPLIMTVEIALNIDLRRADRIRVVIRNIKTHTMLISAVFLALWYSRGISGMKNTALQVIQGYGSLVLALEAVRSGKITIGEVSEVNTHAEEIRSLMDRFFGGLFLFGGFTVLLLSKIGGQPVAQESDPLFIALLVFLALFFGFDYLIKILSSAFYLVVTIFAFIYISSKYNIYIGGSITIIILLLGIVLGLKVFSKSLGEEMFDS